MKNTLLYLVIFSVLINIFQYVNSNKYLDAKNKQIEGTKKNLTVARDSLKVALEENLFDLKYNENAQEYFYAKGIDYTKVIARLNEDINAMNTKKEGNPLVTYDAVNGQPFRVNRIKVLNHRWMVAEYSNGKIWGEIFVKYFINDNEPTKLETIETVLYESTF